MAAQSISTSNGVKRPSDTTLAPPKRVKVSHAVEAGPAAPSFLEKEVPTGLRICMQFALEHINAADWVSKTRTLAEYAEYAVSFFMESLKVSTEVAEELAQDLLKCLRFFTKMEGGEVEVKKEYTKAFLKFQGRVAGYLEVTGHVEAH